MDQSVSSCETHNSSDDYVPKYSTSCIFSLQQIFLQNYEPMATIVADPLHAALHIPGPAGLRATVPGQWLKDALLTLTLFVCLCSLRMRGPSASARCLCVSVSFVERF